MKKILALIGSLALALNCFATGDVGTDVPQSGVINFTALTTTQITNSFSYSYSQQPIVVFTLLTTNAYPVTNLFTTTTNFGIAANTTNASVAWQAFRGYPRFQFGTNATQTLGKITNTFATPYFYPPAVSADGSTTNGVSGNIALSQVTTTNFVVQFGDTNCIIYWSAIGVSTVPGNATITY